MKAIRSVLIVCAVASVAFASPTVAQDNEPTPSGFKIPDDVPTTRSVNLDPKTFQLPWIVEPQAVDSTVLSLKEGDRVTFARLLPGELVVNDTEIRADNGTLLVERGREFTRGVTTSYLACTIRHLGVNIIEFLMTNEKYLCVIDGDGDGSFDKYFFRGTNNTGVLTNRERIPEELRNLSENRYTVLDRTSSKDAPMLEFKYDNYAFLSKWILFVGCIKIAESNVCRPLEDTYGLRQRELPGTFSAFGGRFELLEKTEDGIRVRVLSPFRQQVIVFTN